MGCIVEKLTARSFLSAIQLGFVSVKGLREQSEEHKPVRTKSHTLLTECCSHDVEPGRGML